jgi:hypothetical protein
MKIGEVAGAAGVNVQTVRCYERRGLLEELVTAGRSRSPTTECPILRTLEEDPSSASGGEK